MSGESSRLLQPTDSHPADRRRDPAAPRLGIVGGGQLARMTALAALPLGVEVHVLERAAESPAAPVSRRYSVGDWDDPACLRQLAEQVDVVTLENEFVDSAGLAALEREGHSVLPSARCLGLVQDKLVQKQTLRAAGLPVAEFRAVADLDALIRAGEELGWPLVLKARRDGYDGKGNASVAGPDSAAAAWSRLARGGRRLYAEAHCHFLMELATIVCVGRDGKRCDYPLVETLQRDHVCHVVRAPARVADGLARRALELARSAVSAVAGVGSFGVEMFLTADGRVLVNELAPRVHNSGHYSIEGCVTSQFENHVRAVLGLPLGPGELRVPAAVMVNLLGEREGPGWPTGVAIALAVRDVHLHVYGKAASRPGRKLGHVTALGTDPVETEARARRAAAALGFGGAR